ncbi:hypothetical protein LPJ78_005506 [Coemansia sp. RSA 989]|nr:hypothetical protein BX667DRAFT_514149 [Coemansia mojavensis]KAJ1738751.1 hypothetical protein LPJ68_005287 [Coemansia sp. RSA 1086]KAJ1747166.1 hypothetical protein LPJ79_005435 [Coemansia sp. RSA 1821]KAJ1861146.1 hypothetical protein LPJ78_005506 [Coemansia sp. RSA 989]KAJ1869215.1 hypothetical protein LPJ55_005507 [Coemansia sp. RSA 990]KAJ2629341.1 hypothetical protein H4R22_003380 [Coemansia sp. RSA 1290]KAJ2645954.1 hypothetical protein IWW40_005765 [Coemansia sp. RSA 1250]KAJ26677
MAGRYSKVLTRQNAQMFVGGALLTLTLGHMWLQARRERAAELQRRLWTVQRHMYWSMSLTQRTDVPFRSEQAAYYTQQQQDQQRKKNRLWNTDRVNGWWNEKVAGLGKWVIEPGYFTTQASRLQSTASLVLADGWIQAKDTVKTSSSQAVDRLKETAWWKETSEYLHNSWAEEQEKWRQARFYAINTVHPKYGTNEGSKPHR